ncbi:MULTISPECIES: hypothetical protein [unclassified Corallococcus]|uniref:hypothetical protein n=1 Tax=unclassified Corallococcus TaxID=2685029 RepID=UPI001A8C2263|nr:MULTISPECIES: hypothetical protein [unclassified Corallococcus]MBN9682669.1 hypothetical protein [Corallococcus sp. NCSPR001]WAS85788.1 hypothetical protein O0N60_02165 [Corallococcus sp. NCRR]
MKDSVSAHRGLRHRIAALLLVGLTACGGCQKTDAERAAKERAEIDQRLRDSVALVPYRALKLSVRAGDDPKAPEEVALLWKAVAETRALPDKPITDEATRAAARTYLDLGIAFYKARKTLQTRDEDEFPLLWTRWASGEALPLPSYDAGQEHAFLAAVLLALDTAEKSDRIPATELVFYELSRATPTPGWPAPLRAAVQASRGAAFCQAGYHYAAEEELTGFIRETEALPPEAFPAIQQGTPAQSREAVLAAGHFLRAWNRMGLKRERAAEDDIEQGLRSLQTLGVENELTWWGWAFIHTRRGRYEEAAASLDKLAASPYLEDTERREVHDSAEALRKHGDSLPVFQQTRATLLLGRTLLARAGGLEHVLTVLLGPERAKELYAPLVWMDRVRQRTAALSPEQVAQGAGETLDRAREVGNRGWKALQERLDKTTAQDTPP